MSVETTPPIPSVVIYGDFNCPFSAVASARAGRLSDAGRLHVDWRCVEHDPTIGPDETSLTAEQASGFRDELDQIDGLLTDDEPRRFRVPSRRLNTRELNHRYASTPPSERPALRAAIFDAYWFDDRDLTSATVVADIVDDVTSAPDASAASDAAHTVAAWQREWAELPRPIVPVMVFGAGEVSRGLGALARLASGSVAAPTPEPTDEPTS